MSLERSKRRSFLLLAFIVKCLSKKLLIRADNGMEITHYAENKNKRTAFWSSSQLDSNGAGNIAGIANHGAGFDSSCSLAKLAI